MCCALSPATDQDLTCSRKSPETNVSNRDDVQNFSHAVGHLEFNPTARPGDPDYGLLYTSGSDLGFSTGGGGLY
jgi:hypothetical protein